MLGALAKGRSSRLRCNRLCRRQAALTLGLGIRFYWLYVRTDRNVADGPSRGFGLGVAPKEGPPLPQELLAAEEEMPEEFRHIAG